jgi:hypothetical protein
MSQYLKISLFVLLSAYLLAVSFMLPAVNKAVNFDTGNTIQYSQFNHTVGIGGGEQEFTLVRSIADLPFVLNLILIILPFIAWIVTAVTMFYPT